MTKNIALFSDGTGQRGGVGYESNVWQLFHAIEHDETQLRCYGDGVGTEDFKLFKALGGGLGLGLGQNVRDLYTFLVRNYQAGDQIYLFGFSRGAFTVRLLAGMIARCGIIDIHHPDINTEKDLNKLVKAAYCTYRERGYHKSRADRFRSIYSHHPNEKQSIRFVGVWDTVDALGVPFDELREIIDRILHYSFKDKTLHPNIDFACHAVAINDERKTFHPIMWDEKNETSERIEQVWFTGVHSNVGGGYPKKELATVTLHWMMEQAKKQGLKIRAGEQETVQAEADVTGKLYDSRSGLGAYYRYLPRNLETIRQSYTNGPLKIHPSALQRVEQASNNYSPFNLTANSIKTDGSASFDSNETWDKAMQYSWDSVWWRRVSYYCFVLLTFFTLALPAFHQHIPNIESEFVYWLGGQLTFISVKLADLSGMGWLVNSTLGNNIISTFVAKPFVPIFIALVAIILLLTRTACKKTENCLASAGWATIYPGNRPKLDGELTNAGQNILLKIARLARCSSLLKGLTSIIKESFILSSVVLLWPFLVITRKIHNWLCFRGKVLKKLRSKK